ncbi:hypothetical protein ETAA8_33580 [Anatilimnocola aggregata]|uniref:Uncharacterized protein n=1 Tax=Anatilimnocola aggregata TaxID=2528021 RepID=A0A517YDF1_9BACT|nr:hypothetical protein [Anatilimnocola aggregata]QDU28258.1 hypothetical protein ETAA8_33580 [Anatilimnocola aggregata]
MTGTIRTRLVAMVMYGAMVLVGCGVRTSSSIDNKITTKHQTVYVVHEFMWRWRSNRSPLVLDEGRPGKPVKSFLDRERAEEHCRALNLHKRAKSNPFRYLPEEGEYTSMDRVAFLAAVRAEGLIPPADSPEAGNDELAWIWFEWWENHRREWDNDRVERLWKAMDRVYFYEVLPVELVP